MLRWSISEAENNTPLEGQRRQAARVDVRLSTESADSADVRIELDSKDFW